MGHLVSPQISTSAEASSELRVGGVGWGFPVGDADTQGMEVQTLSPPAICFHVDSSVSRALRSLWSLSHPFNHIWDPFPGPQLLCQEALELRTRYPKERPGLTLPLSFLAGG